jgi:hypothetical protein
MLATGPSELTMPANTAAIAYVAMFPGNSTHANPVATSTSAVRRALALAPIRSALAPPITLATIEIRRPTISTVAAAAAEIPHRSTANVVRNGIAPYCRMASTMPT